MKLVKKIFKNKTFKDKNGKSHYSTCYVIVTDTGAQIQVKPIHSNGYVQLDTISEIKVYDNKDN